MQRVSSAQVAWREATADRRIRTRSRDGSSGSSERADLPLIDAGRDAKIDWKALSVRIGHADVAFTMRQYVQADLETGRSQGHSPS